MVIRKEDRVSTVLRHDESLIEVFAALSPAFERLRNPAMRKVMSRLVTVEQAARMAGLDAAELVARLNAGQRSQDAHADRAADAVDSGGATSTPAEARSIPAVLAAMPADRIIDVDVREDLHAGREPFSRIMAALREVPDGGALRVRAIFEPVPLYAVMKKHELAHHTERLGDEDWRVWFHAAGQGSEAPEPPRQPAGETQDVEAPDGVIVLDVRGLEPPEPMVMTLAAVETMPAGATLLHINVRVPRFLLPLLEERGFTYEIREQEPDLVRVFIRRAQTRT